MIRKLGINQFEYDVEFKGDVRFPEITSTSTSLDTIVIDSTGKLFKSSSTEPDGIGFDTNSDLILQQPTSNKDIIIKAPATSDSGDVEDAIYITIDSSESKTIVNKTIEFQDNVKLAIGNSEDLTIDHNATNSRLINYTGNLRIVNGANDGDITFESDDGSGGVTTYFKLDGSSATHDGSATTSMYTQWEDNSIISLGTGKDFNMYHTGTKTIFTNATGHLDIRNTATNSDIIFQADDGGGSFTTYFQVDGGNERTIFKQPTSHDDNVFAMFGNDLDLRVYHDGTDSFIKSDGTGDLYIQQANDDKDIVFQCDNGSGGLTAYFQLDGSDALTKFSKNTLHIDNARVALGAGFDFEMYHNGTNTVMRNYTGDLQIIATDADKDIVFLSDDGSGGETEYFRVDGSAETNIFTKPSTFNNTVVMGSQQLKFADNGKVRLGDSNDLDLYHDGTDSKITNANGHLKIEIDADDKDFSIFADDQSGGLAEYFRVDGSLGINRFIRDSRHNDNITASFGDGDDLQIRHDGTDSIIDNLTGTFYIRNQADDKDIVFICDNSTGSTETYFRLDGSANTAGNPVTLFPDNSLLGFGEGFGDLQLHHDGSNSYIKNRSTGDLHIRQDVDDKDIILEADDGSGGVTAYITLDGSATKTIFQKPIDVGADTSGHDVRFYGAASGEQMLWDSSESQLKINHDTDDYGLGIFTVSSEAMSQAQLRVGRDEGQYWGVYTRDRDANVIHRQDETSGIMKTNFVQWDSNTSETTGLWQWQHGTGSGGSIATAMTLTQAGDLSFTTGNITSDSSFSSDLDVLDITVNKTGGSAVTNVKGINLNVGSNDHISGNDITNLYGAYINNSTSGSSATVIQNWYGVYVPAADSDRVSNRISAYFADSVGIGTDSPASTLHVSGTVQVGVDDTGHDVKFFGATAGKYMLWDESDDSLNFPDSTQIKIGASADLRLYHDGSDSYVRGYNHDLIIMQDTADKDIKFKADDGSGGTATYLTLDGSVGYITVQKAMRFGDGKTLQIGDSADLSLSHDGTDSSIVEKTGDLIIENTADDKDIIFKSDDGSGGTTTYFRLDGSAGVYTNFPDNSTLSFGSDHDLRIAHDGATASIFNTVGNLQIINYADDKDVLFRSDDGSGGIETYFFLDGSVNGSDPMTIFPDNSYLGFGDNYDLYINHSGSGSFIQNTTGDLSIIQNTDDGDIIFKSDDGSGGTMTYFFLDGSAKLSSFQNADVIFYGASSYMQWDQSQDSLELLDNVKIKFGTGADLQIFHDGTTSKITNDTGDIHIQNNTDDGDIILRSDDGSGGTTAYITLDGSLTRTIANQHLQMADGKALYVGAGSDAGFYHLSGHNYIENNTGDLIIVQNTNDGDIIFQSDDGSGGTTTYMTIDGGAAITTVSREMRFFDSVKLKLGSGPDVEFYHDGSNTYLLNDTGNLDIRCQTNDGDIIFRCDDGSGGNAEYIRIDGSVTTTKFSMKTLHADNVRANFGTGSDANIRHDGTDTYIGNSTGHFYIQQAADDKDLVFQCDDGSGGLETYFMLDGSSKRIDILDDIRLTLGTSDDLQIYHNATNSIIENYTGDLFIKNNTDDGDIKFQCDDGSGGVTEYFRLDGGSEKTFYSKPILLFDSVALQLGTGTDATLYHSGGEGTLQNFTGNFRIIQGADNSDIQFFCDDGSGGTTEYFRIDGGTETVEVSKPINLASASSSASSGIYAQFINLKGFCTLAANYQFAEDLEDTKSPFEMALDYGSATISSSTEVNQSQLFRAAGFHVPVACSVNAINMQVTCNNTGNVTIAVVEYRPSEAGTDQVDHPRTVYEEVVVASNDNNNKVKTVTVATADLDNTAIPAGSHIMIMAKGDSDSIGGSTFISAAIEIKW